MGPARRQVTTSTRFPGGLTWSPDGTRLAFVAPGRAEGGDSDIYVVNVETGEEVNITEDPAPDNSPDGSPN